ncbi:MFS general substrate transporter [Corynespora cassiicola Philippines]|uniref:MFS general substrate transporter n=1 Tax=Corynespora cassiicola Philippines TaxID=1448308 RepID=A0A2T2PAZ3_CORCC|nr:MFS general substrate transporter [Corynespora cassiicola Philippines]
MEDPEAQTSKPGPSEPSKSEVPDKAVVASIPQARTWRFWGVFAALCLLAFLSSLDVAIITTALPTITKEIGGETQYVWIANSFIIASCVPQPLFGQLANIFGRRIPMMVCTMLFAVGSGIAGGASNVGMMISGRTIQGVGAGGVYVLLDIICCDLVPLRERGKYLGLMFSWAGLAAALGPVLGGALADADWRWIFYLNIPICGVALGAILLFMRVKYTRSASWKHALARVDYLGNLIFIPSIIAILFGLVMGGVQYPWSSWRVILPLVLGVLGWIGFHVQQMFCSEPSVPARLFANRTSAIAFVLTFLSSVIVQAISYFMPVYFQAVKGENALRAGVSFLPFAIGTLTFAVVAGALLSKFGAYRPLHAIAFGLSAIAFGLFTLLDENTSRVAWAFFQLIASAGSGMILSVLLPAIMAALPESDVASSSAAYSFIRTFGYIWGVTIASIIFNAEFNSDLYKISDESTRAQLADGAAYAFASQQLVDQLGPTVKQQVVGVYVGSLKTVWWVGLGISLVGLFAVAGERGLELRKELDTEFGLDDEKKDSSNSVGTVDHEVKQI